LTWNPDWPRFRVVEYVATGVFLGGAIGSLAIQPDEARWTQVNHFDSFWRSRLRLGSARSRQAARDASDILLTFGINHLIFDSLVVAWWGHGSGDVAWQIAMMDIEAMGFNAMLNGLVAGLTSRQRPYRARCNNTSLERIHDCRQDRRYRSFFSGHTSTAFTIAGLTCSHHAHLPLYGGGAADRIACATSFLMAGTIGLLRVASDQHYTTDVLTGAAIGTLTGLGMPWLFHYRGGARPKAPANNAGIGVKMGFVPMPFGGAVVGAF